MATRQKPVCQLGGVQTNGNGRRAKVSTTNLKAEGPTHHGPDADTKAAADLAYAQGARTRGEMKQRLQGLLRRKDAGRNETTASGLAEAQASADRKKEQFGVRTWKQWGPAQQTNVEDEANLLPLYATDAAAHDDLYYCLCKRQQEMAPLRGKPVSESGTIASAGRKKEQFRVQKWKQWGPTRQTKVEAGADLLYARDAATHEEFADRLRILHEIKATCRPPRPVCKGGTIASAGRTKGQLCVRSLIGDAALDGSLATASAAPRVDTHHYPCKRKGNFDSGTDVAVLDGSCPPSEKRLRVELGGG